MAANAQENEDHNNMPTTQQNPPASATKDKKKKFQDKMKGFLKQIVSNFSNLIASFQATTDLLKNMDAHMATLVQKL